MARKRNAKGIFVSQGEPASEAVRSRLQKSVHEALMARAAAAGISTSEYIRQAVREKLARDGESES